jgi:hypothetical protein
MNKMILRSSATLLAVFIGLLLAGCTVHVDDKDNKNPKVDIQTPLANLKVDTSEASSDNGIPVYPGARPRPKDGGDNHRANVNIAAMGFGLKVIAAEYESDDSPDKVKGFYQDKLGKWGDVVVCKGHNDNGKSVDIHGDHGSQKVSCGDSRGDGWELKVGTNDNQHIVSIQPEGKGTRFGTVLLQTHGKEGEL